MQSHAIPELDDNPSSDITKFCRFTRGKEWANKIHNHNNIKILESDWSSVGLISAVIVQLHTSCACNWTVVRVMPE